MIGQLVGNYRVIRQIGQGGMGQVFEAVHEYIKRRAAIKILHPEYSNDPEVIRRFFNEALAVNVVQHPSIVGVFESGQLPTGAVFLVMEFLDGETLASHLNRSEAFNESEALHLIRQVASALAAAHAKDIVHRDLKPDNVMLVKDPEVPGGRRVKILDFGLAKIAAKHQAHVVPTKDGTIMGTPSYMPPEQWMSASTADAKSDVYSLGVILFEALTGRCPFLGDNINQVMMGHMYDDPPLATKFEKKVSAGATALVNQMLAKTRTARPTMAQVSAHIEQLLLAVPSLERVVAVEPAKPRDVATVPTILQGAPGPIAQPSGPMTWTNVRIITGSTDGPTMVAPASPTSATATPHADRGGADSMTVVAAAPASQSPAPTRVVPMRPQGSSPASQDIRAAAPTKTFMRAPTLRYLVLGVALLLSALLAILLLR